MMLRRLLIFVAMVCATNVWGQLRIEQLDVVRSADSLTLGFGVDFLGRMAPRNYKLVVTPRIVGDQRSLEFPSVVLATRRTQVFDWRDRVGAEADAIEILRSDSLGYLASVEFEDWMASGRVVIDREVVGCRREYLLDPLVYRYELAEYETVDGAVQAPLSESCGCAEWRDVAWSQRVMMDNNVKIYFAINSSLVDTPVNRAILSEVVASLEGGAQCRLSIVGYASPDGADTLNCELAGRRADAMEQYLASKLPRVTFEVVDGGEDWAGLERMVAAGDLPNRKRVCELIGEALGSDDFNSWRLKSQIMAIDDSRTWDQIRSLYFGELRRVDVTIMENRNFREK